MAERDYMRGEGVTPIQDMSTRQLRRYIRERAEEAQERLNTMPEDVSQAWDDQLWYVSSFGLGREGGIKKDTSRMDKITMVEYAYALRDLNMLDTASKFARDQDYKENKQRYQSFVKEQLKSLNPNSREYWSQFITLKGNISKKGYREYKNYINWIKNLDEVMSTYGYETIKDIYFDQSDARQRKQTEDLLLETWQANKGKGMTPRDLIDDFYDRLNKARKEENKKKVKGSSKRSGSGSRTTGKKSNQNIGIKQGAKLKNGRVREKQGTQKL